MQIFISHSDEDRELAQELTADLERAHFTVWNPNEILPGDNWANEVGKALETSELMVVLYTNNANQSPTVRHEIQYGMTSGSFRGRVIPVLVDFKTFQAGTDVPWALLRLDPIYLESAARDFSPIVQRVDAVLRNGCNAST
jgi:hypothetical protein